MTSGDNQKQVIGLRIKDARSALDLTQKELCEKAGMKLPSLRDYELGNRIPGGEAVADLARVGINANWLLTGEGEMLLSANERAFSSDLMELRKTTDAVVNLNISDERKRQVRDILFAVSSGKTELIELAFSTAQNTDQLVMVPRYDVQASAGGGVLIHSELIVDYLAFRQDWVSKMGLIRNKLALVEVHGDSMEPALNNQDLILVDLRTCELSVNGIYVIQHRGHLLVKRIQIKMDGSVVVKSDNPAYDSELLSREDASSLTVLGRVVWFGRGM